MQFIIYSGAAASDLKREIEKQTISPAIAEYIFSKMNINSAETNDVDTPDNMTEEISSVECINGSLSPTDSEIGVIQVSKNIVSNRVNHNLLNRIYRSYLG